MSMMRTTKVGFRNNYQTLISSLAPLFNERVIKSDTPVYFENHSRIWPLVQKTGFYSKPKFFQKWWFLKSIRSSISIWFTIMISIYLLLLLNFFMFKIFINKLRINKFAYNELNQATMDVNNVSIMRNLFLGSSSTEGISWINFEWKENYAVQG